jgi:flagellar basal body rod protein FlgG
MIQGFYAAASALDVAAQNQDVLAQNIAHAMVPGYRRQGLTFETLTASPSGKVATGKSTNGGASLGAKLSTQYTNFEPGAFQFTGSPLDLALGGDSFFEIEGPNGPLFTRNGGFQLNVKGELETQSGQGVAGSGGKIVIPPNTRSITVTDQGAVLADRSEVGRLKIVRFANPQALRSAGTTLFEAPPGVTPEAGTGPVRQGYRESSNVQVVNEMVLMIAGMRQYEAAQRALRSMSDAIQMSTQPQGG